MQVSGFDKAPPVSKELVEFLEARYATRLTSIPHDASDRVVGIMIGRAEVVAYLRNLHERQSNPKATGGYTPKG